MLQKLKLKLVVINVALLTVVLVAVFVSVYFLLESQLISQERTLLNKVAADEITKMQGFAEKGKTNKSIAENTGGDYKDFLIENEKDFLPSSSYSMRMFYVRLYREYDIISISSDIILNKKEDIVYLLNKVDGIGKKSGEVDLTGYIKLSFLVADGKSGGRLYVFIERTNREKTMSAYIYTAFIALLGSVICVFFISVYMAGRAIKPIKESMESQDKFIADASHELRTPISVIRSNAELIMDSPNQTVGENMKWLEYIYKEAVRMTKMTEDLLLLSQFGKKTKNEASIAKENINLSDVVSEVYDSFTPLFTENSLSAGGADIEKNIFISANEADIRQLLTILLDNAVKYTKEKRGCISIKLEKDEHYAYIKVIDTGIGMTKDMSEKIFERFFRGDKARSKSTGGFGLGLSIAKTISEEHGGKITVGSELGKGSEFCVKLPVIMSK